MQILIFLGALTLLTLIITASVIISIACFKHYLNRNFNSNNPHSTAKKICPKCGAALASTANFCPICGFKFH